MSGDAADAERSDGLLRRNPYCGWRALPHGVLVSDPADVDSVIELPQLLGALWQLLERPSSASEIRSELQVEGLPNDAWLDLVEQISEMSARGLFVADE